MATVYSCGDGTTWNRTFPGVTYDSNIVMSNNNPVQTAITIDKTLWSEYKVNSYYFRWKEICEQRPDGLPIFPPSYFSYFHSVGEGWINIRDLDEAFKQGLLYIDNQQLILNISMIPKCKVKGLAIITSSTTNKSQCKLTFIHRDNWIHVTKLVLEKLV